MINRDGTVCCIICLSSSSNNLRTVFCVEKELTPFQHRIIFRILFLARSGVLIIVLVIILVTTFCNRRQSNNLEQEVIAKDDDNLSAFETMANIALCLVQSGLKRTAAMEHPRELNGGSTGKNPLLALPRRCWFNFCKIVRQKATRIREYESRVCCLTTDEAATMVNGSKDVSRRP
jgi:hypothetical protein